MAPEAAKKKIAGLLSGAPKGGDLPRGLLSKGSMSKYTPTMREKIAGLLAKNWYGDTREGYRQAEKLVNVGETVVPPLGLLSGSYDAGRALGGGDIMGSGMSMAMAFAPGPDVKKFRGFKGMNAYVIDGTHPNYVERELVDLTKGRSQHSWNSENSPKNAGFFGSNPDVASHFAEALTPGGAGGHLVGGGAVFPTEISFNNPLVIDGKGRHAADFQFGSARKQWDDYFSDPKFAQYDGVILKNVKDAGGVTDIYVPKDPEQIAHKLPKVK